MSEQDASVHAIAGALGGLLSLGLFYPLDVLRSLVQLDDPRVRCMSCRERYSFPSPPALSPCSFVVLEYKKYIKTLTTPSWLHHVIHSVLKLRVCCIILLGPVL